MKLTELSVNKYGTIKRIDLTDNNILRAMTLGLIEETRVKVLSKTSGGIELLVNNARIAISNDLAQNIIII